MNEFTKQELECLHNAIALQLKNIPMSETNAIRRSELVVKLQTMIENYCEHEWHPGGSRPWLHCIKCKSNFNHEPYPY
jgi:hypothetical protein